MEPYIRIRTNYPMKHTNLKHTSRPNRRDFLKTSAAFGAITILPSYIALGNQSSAGVAPSEKVNVALVGIGNRANGNRKSLYTSGICNIVALCDIDLKGSHTLQAQQAHPLVPTFTDFRKMFDKMADEIDAVVVTTPDHSHFAVTMLAMSLGKHVYVEKPLAHTFGQCVRMIDLAARSGVATQMGNQGHSGANYFQFKAWSEAGIIKDVTRITAYMTKPRRWHGWGQDVTEYPTEPLPVDVDWDQWIDSAAQENPFSHKLHPAEWRSWFNYGSGCFGDWGPHILDTSHRFLKLGLPETIKAMKREGANDFIFPQASTIQFNFPAREAMPPCTVSWYDGIKNLPSLEAEYNEPVDGVPVTKATQLNGAGKIIYSKDLVFKGGSHASALQIVPKQKYMDMRKSLPSFPQKNSSHQTNFLLACKGEEATRSPFHVGGELTQVFNLGMLAQRLGGELRFDRKSKQITNNKVAQALLDPAPRKGWEEFYAL